MNYDKNWLQRFLAYLRRAWTFSGTATLLLTIFNVVVHGPRHLLLHVALHILRVPFLRVMMYMLVGPVSLMLAGAFALIWLTYRPTTPADLRSVSGIVAQYGRDDLDRFVIALEEYNNMFIPHAEIDTFDAQQFMRDVQPGDVVHFRMRNNDHQRLNNGELLVVFEIRSDTTTYIAFGPSLAAEHHDRTVTVPWTAAIFGAISAACAGLFMWDSRRNYA